MPAHQILRTTQRRCSSSSAEAPKEIVDIPTGPELCDAPARTLRTARGTSGNCFYEREEDVMRKFATLALATLAGLALAGCQNDNNSDNMGRNTSGGMYDNRGTGSGTGGTGTSGGSGSGTYNRGTGTGSGTG